MGKLEVIPTSDSCAFAQSGTLLHKALTTTVVSNSTLGSLIQALVIIWPKNPIFSFHIYPVLAKKRCRLLMELLLHLVVKEMCLFHQRLPLLLYCMLQKCLVTFCQSANLQKPTTVQELFSQIIVFSRTLLWGRWLAVLRREMAYTT